MLRGSVLSSESHLQARIMGYDDSADGTSVH